MKVVLQAVSLVESYSGNSLKWLPGGLKIKNVLGEYASANRFSPPHSKTSSAAPDKNCLRLECAYWPVCAKQGRLHLGTNNTSVFLLFHST